MKSFVVLSAKRSLEQVCTELSAHFGFIKRRHALWVPPEMLGMWVGRVSDVLSTPAREPDVSAGEPPRVALDIRSTIGVAGGWTIAHARGATLCRVRLLDELVARSAGRWGERRPRFVPVFLRSAPGWAVRSELSQLSGRHPYEVCRPLVMSPMSGALSPFDAQAGAHVHAPT